MASTKAPDNDGFPALLFQTFWILLGLVLLSTVLVFWIMVRILLSSILQISLQENKFLTTLFCPYNNAFTSAEKNAIENNNAKNRDIYEKKSL